MEFVVQKGMSTDFVAILEETMKIIVVIIAAGVLVLHHRIGLKVAVAKSILDQRQDLQRVWSGQAMELVPQRGIITYFVRPFAILK
jgi:hypothetical protein